MLLLSREANKGKAEESSLDKTYWIWQYSILGNSQLEVIK